MSIKRPRYDNHERLFLSFQCAGESTSVTLAAVQWRMHIRLHISAPLLYIHGRGSYRLISIMEQDKLIEDCDVAGIRLHLSHSEWLSR